MKNFLSIMDWDKDNRVAKYLDFDLQSEAVAHVAVHLTKHPNAFVTAMPNDSFASWRVDPVAKTLSIDFPVVIPPTDKERIDQAFPPTDNATVIKSLLIEILNRLSALDGGSVLDKPGLETLMKSKLP